MSDWPVTNSTDEWAGSLVVPGRDNLFIGSSDKCELANHRLYTEVTWLSQIMQTLYMAFEHHCSVMPLLQTSQLKELTPCLTCRWLLNNTILLKTMSQTLHTKVLTPCLSCRWVLNTTIVFKTLLQTLHSKVLTPCLTCRWVLNTTILFKALPQTLH